MTINSLAVFCGSKDGIDGVYVGQALQLGKLMAENNIKMIYGGGSSGLMGVVADAVMHHQGKVTGIIPHVLLEWERQHHGITELIIADDMHVEESIETSITLKTPTEVNVCEALGTVVVI